MVVEGTTNAIFVKDCSGRYVLANTACAQIFGKSKSQVIGKDDTALLVPNTARELIETDRRIITTGQTQAIENLLEITAERCTMAILNAQLYEQSDNSYTN